MFVTGFCQYITDKKYEKVLVNFDNTAANRLITTEFIPIPENHQRLYTGFETRRKRASWQKARHCQSAVIVQKPNRCPVGLVFQ